MSLAAYAAVAFVPAAVVAVGATIVIWMERR